jgi:hypothetical protein
MSSSNIQSITTGSAFVQIGNGTPDHISPVGSMYTDLLTATEYINKDGLVNWEVTGGGGVTFTVVTVAGPTYFLAGLSSTTVSAETYENLPTELNGGTY